MKYPLILFLLIFLLNCSQDEDQTLNGSFKFVSKYSATVTVGGVVGITERTFEIGEIYEGIDEGEENILIRIAKHSELNEDCPNSWCYQEFLTVPRDFLNLVE